MQFKSLFLAGAAIVTLGTVIAGGAQAEPVYTTRQVGPTVTTTTGQEVVNQSYTAVGTRKVGMVGYRAYPMQAARVETNTVRTLDPTTTVNYTNVGAPASADISASSSVSTTTSGAPIAYSTGGGKYYTERNTRAYQDPSLNIDVRSSGGFND